MWLQQQQSGNSPEVKCDFGDWKRRSSGLLIAICFNRILALQMKHGRAFVHADKALFAFGMSALFQSLHLCCTMILSTPMALRPTHNHCTSVIGAQEG